MNLVDLIDRRIAQALARLRFLVERVDQPVFGAQVVTGKGAGGDDVEAEAGGFYGFQSFAPDGGEGILLKVEGHGANAVLVAYRVRAHEKTLEKGELRLFDDQGQEIGLYRDRIEILGGGSPLQDAFIKVYKNPSKVEMKSGTLQDFLINGGTKGAARVDDEVQVTIPINTVVVDVVGGVPVLNPDPIILTGKINQGSVTVKIG